jgi:hypothetical protein
MAVHCSFYPGLWRFMAVQGGTLTGFAQGWGAGASRFGALLKALHHLHNQ